MTDFETALEVLWKSFRGDPETAGTPGLLMLGIHRVFGRDALREHCKLPAIVRNSTGKENTVGCENLLFRVQAAGAAKPSKGEKE